MDFVQVDVFADGAFRGNPLAVFPDAADLSAEQMLAIAREMNLSETTFVSAVGSDSYDVRIFTQNDELPFAGHPTIGTSWVLRRMGRLSEDRVIQRSPAGETTVVLTDKGASFERTGAVEADLETSRPDAHAAVAAALGLEEDEVGLDASVLGKSGRLLPAVSNAGIPVFIAPVRDQAALRSIDVRRDLLVEIDPFGAYCFTALAPGHIEARGLFPGTGNPEDPATGAGAAALGLFLADRLGEIEATIDQGLQINRPSVIELAASPGTVTIGGSCHFVFSGNLEALPG